MIQRSRGSVRSGSDKILNCLLGYLSDLLFRVFVVSNQFRGVILFSLLLALAPNGICLYFSNENNRVLDVNACLWLWIIWHRTEAGRNQTNLSERAPVSIINFPKIINLTLPMVVNYRSFGNSTRYVERNEYVYRSITNEMSERKKMKYTYIPRLNKFHPPKNSS